MEQNVEKILQDFCGTWNLISEKSNYTLGTPPMSGTYIIELSNGKVLFNVSWKDYEDKKFQVKFEGVPDGKQYLLAGTPGVDSVKYEVTVDRKFVSVAYNGDVILNEASRTLLEDGTLLFVTQRILGPDGKLHANSSIYKKS